MTDEEERDGKDVQSRIRARIRANGWPAGSEMRTVKKTETEAKTPLVGLVKGVSHIVIVNGAADVKFVFGPGPRKGRREAIASAAGSETEKGH